MDWEEKYKLLEAKFNELEEKHTALNKEHLGLLEDHNLVQEALDAHSQLAEDLEEQLKEEEETRKKATLDHHRQNQRSISIANALTAGQEELKQKQSKLNDIEELLAKAKLEGEEGKKKVEDLTKQRQVADNDISQLKIRMEDRSSHLQLLKEQQMYYELEIAEYARLAKVTKKQMIILQVENRRLKPNRGKKKKKEKTAADITLQQMKKNKAVMDKMKHLMEDAFSSPDDNLSLEEREKRKIMVSVITRMMVLKNGFSASDPFEKRMWLKLKKNMKSVCKCMVLDAKAKKTRRNSKSRRRNSNASGSRKNSTASGSPKMRRGSLKKSKRTPKSKSRRMSSSGAR